IGVAPSHSWEDDERIELDSDSEEKVGENIEGELGRDEDEGVGPSKGTDTQEILRVVREEASVERETLVSEETFGGDDESMMRQHHAFGFGKDPAQLASPTIAATDPIWMLRDP
ncbi:hypothetical protein KI387_036569, partial [Taxus chinensis]